MPSSFERSYEQRSAYRMRMLSCVAGALLLLILVFNFWPQPGMDEPEPFPYHTGGQELISMEEVQPTRQRAKPPPPPPPLIPLLVSDDIIIESELEVEEALLILEEYGEDIDVAEVADGGEAGAAKAPQVGPKPVRFVEPEYTREARRKKIKAEVVIEVLVDEKGRVQDAKILNRFLYSKDKKQTVESLSYGLEESALSAARRWTFRPALENGTPVQSYTTLTFSFGV